MVKNSPCNAGDMSVISGQGTEILHPVRQLSPCNTSIETTDSRVYEPLLEKACVLQ